MVSGNMDVILTQLGWGDGFRIPVANEENKRLEEEIERKTEKRAKLNIKLSWLEDRLKTVDQCKKTMIEQQDSNQKLLVIHSAQLKSEEHMLFLSNNLESNLIQERRRFDKEYDEINNRTTNLQKDCSKVEEILKNTNNDIKIDQQFLNKLNQVLNEKENDCKILQRFMKEDKKRFQELELKRQRLTGDLETWRCATFKVIDQLHEIDVVQKRTRQLHQEAQKEYDSVMNQWAHSIELFKQKGDNMQNTLREIDCLRERIEDKKNDFQERENFLKDQIVNNAQLEDTIKQYEKKFLFLKNEQRKMIDTLSMYTIEVATQKKNVEQTARRTEQYRVRSRQKKAETEKKYLKLEDLRKRINNLRETWEEIDNQKLTMEDKSKQLQEMIEQEEKRKSLIGKELKRLQACNLRTLGQIRALEKEKKMIDLQCQTERKKIESLDSQYPKLEKILNEKKKLLYEVELNVEKCHIELKRLRGNVRSKEEIDENERRINGLQKTLNENNAILKLLQGEIASLEHDMKGISINLSTSNVELERLRNKKEDLVLLVEAGEKQFKLEQSRSEEKQVEENLLRLRVTQMRQMVNKFGNRVYNLEKYRLRLDAALKEREAEILAQKESLAIRNRVAANERSETKCAINERKIRIKQLQTKYETGVAALGQTPDGEPMSTTYLTIQSTQERYILQEQGDKLDETIRKTEQEIQCMENTLRVVNSCNDKYKFNTSSIDPNGPEVRQQKQLQDETHRVKQTLKQKHSDLQQIVHQIQRLEDDCKSSYDDIEKIKEDKQEKERLMFDMEHQLTEQKEKISRAEKNLRKAYKDIRLMCQCRDDNLIQLQEMEVTLNQLQQQNALVLQEIAEFTIRHIEVESYLKKLLSIKNINLPNVASSRHSESSEFNFRHSISSPAGNSLKSIDRKSSSMEFVLEDQQRSNKKTGGEKMIGSKKISFEKTLATPTCSSRDSIGSIVNIEINVDNVEKANCSTRRDQKCPRKINTLR